MPSPHWVGIDQGYSQMGLAILAPNGEVLASEKTREPERDGHDRTVALSRLRVLLARVDQWRATPVRLAGYCYEHSGVDEAFGAAGWCVEGRKALNDVIGPYGLTEMRGHTVVACCGTFSQVVYVDAEQAVRWAGDDVADQLPAWPLSGQEYAKFVAALGGDEAIGATQADDVERAPHMWRHLGPVLSDNLEVPAVRAFVERAAAAVRETRDVLWRTAGTDLPPGVVLGGGAVSDDRLWALLMEFLRARGVVPERAEGDPAVGLARFAMAHPDADAWAVLGCVRPGWLS